MLKNHKKIRDSCRHRNRNKTLKDNFIQDTLSESGQSYRVCLLASLKIREGERAEYYADSLPPLLSDMGYAIRRNGGGKALPKSIGFEPIGISLPA